MSILRSSPASARRRQGLLLLLAGGAVVATSAIAPAQQIRSDTAVSPAVARLFPRQPTGFVTDSGALLSPTTRRALESTLATLKRETGAEIAVVTLPSLGTSDRTTVALSIGRRYKVGAAARVGDVRRHLGMVLLLVPRTAEHRGAIEIATGNGAEGFVVDATAGRLARQFAEPMRAGSYDVVARGLVDSLVARTRGAVPVTTPPAARTEEGASILVIILVVGVFGAVFLAVVFLSKAGKAADTAPDTQPLPPSPAGSRRPVSREASYRPTERPTPRPTPRAADPDKDERSSRRSSSSSWSDTSSSSDDAGSSSPFSGDGGGMGGGGGGTDI